jgi:hypothetical protein
MARRTADDSAYARQNLFHVERLRDVIIRSRIECLDLIVPAVSRRQRDHRHGTAGFAPILQNGDAILQR